MPFVSSSSGWFSFGRNQAAQGFKPPKISVGTNQLTIGSTIIGATSTAPITVTNTGGRPLIINSLNIYVEEVNWNNVVLLLNMNGTSGSTVFTDSSSYVRTVTANGNAQLDTITKKYGTASAYFDGDGDYLSIPANSNFNFGAGDFTIEAWLNTNSGTGSYNTVVGVWDSSFMTTGDWALRTRFSDAYQIAFTIRNAGGWTDVLTGVSINDGNWHHVAVVRSGSIITIYIDGVAKSSATNSTALRSDISLTVGGNIGAKTTEKNYTGYIDDLRITKNVARYTSNFAVPTAQLSSTAETTEFTVSGCSAAIVSNNTCTLTVAFAPTTTGSKSAILSIAHNAAGSPTVISLNSTAAAAVSTIGLSSTSLSVAAAPINSTSTGTIIVTNTGNVPLTVGSLSVQPIETYWNNVVALLNMNGANGSTTFTDSSSFAKTVTAYGTAQLTTTVKKYGTASGYFNGGGYLDVTNSSDLAFGAGNFTVEFWLKMSTGSAQWARILSNEIYNQGDSGWEIVRNYSTSNIGFYVSNTNSSLRPNMVSDATVIDDTWHHIAVVRSSNTISMFVDGAKQTSTINATGISFQVEKLRIAAIQGTVGSFMVGYIDDLRVTKGVARYTSNFVPPTEQYSAAIPGVESEFSVVGCTGIIAPNDNCTLTVTFAPATAGSKLAALLITHTANNSPSTVTLSGTALALEPIINLSNTSLEIPPTVVNSTNTKTITVTNTGYAPLVIGNLTVATADIYWNNVVTLLNMNGANGSTSFTDGSSYAKPFTVGGAPQISTAVKKYGTASGYFNGSAYLALPSDVDMAFGTGDFTIELWLRANSVSTFQRIIFFSDNIDNFDINNSTLTYFDGSVTSFGTIAANTWYHAAVTRQSGGIRLFLNGTLIAARSGSANTSTRTLMIAADSRTGSAADAFDGYLDDVRITKGVARYTSSFTPPTRQLPTGVGVGDFTVSGCTDAIAPNDTCTLAVTFAPTIAGSKAAILSITHNANTSPSTVNLSSTALALEPVISLSNTSLALPLTTVNTTNTATITVTNTGTTPLVINSLSVTGDKYQNNVVALLNMNGPAGSTTFADSSTYNRAVTVGGNAQLSTTQSKFGGASAYINGTNSYMTMPSSTDFDFGTGDFTIEFWIYYISGGNYATLIGRRAPNPTFPTTQWGIGLNLNNTIGFNISTGSGWVWGNGVSAATPLPTNQWTHLAITRASGTFRVFINGKQDLATSVPNNFETNTASQPIYIGTAGSETLTAYIDDLRITKGIARYISNFTVPTDQYSPASAHFAVSGCTGSVESATSCTLTVTFAPITPGYKSETLLIAHNATGSPSAVSLTGNALAVAPAASLSTSTLNIASVLVGSTSTGTITVTNFGSAPLTISSLAITGTNAGEFSVGGCSADIAPAASCTLTVTVAPTSAGSKSATLTITHNGSNSPSIVSLSGGGYPVPAYVGNWTYNATALPSYKRWTSAAYGGGQFVAISENPGGYAGDLAAYSTDGISWSAATLPAVASWRSVTYGNGIFVAIASPGFLTGGSLFGSSPAAMAYSVDGVTWTLGSGAGFTGWSYPKITFGNGVFVAVYGNEAIYSTDGQYWAHITLPTSAANVVYGNGRFVAATGNQQAYCHSIDGITWTLAQLPSAFSSKSGSKSLLFAEGKFFMFASQSMITSTDGITWTISTFPGLYGGAPNAAYGGGTFVVMSSTIGGGYTDLVTSTDGGITWSDIGRFPINTTVYVSSIAYGNGRFIAVQYENYTGSNGSRSVTYTG